MEFFFAFFFFFGLEIPTGNHARNGQAGWFWVSLLLI